jgi:hypothetical protein
VSGDYLGALGRRPAAPSPAQGTFRPVAATGQRSSFTGALGLRWATAECGRSGAVRRRRRMTSSTRRPICAGQSCAHGWTAVPRARDARARLRWACPCDQANEAPRALFATRSSCGLTGRLQPAMASPRSPGTSPTALALTRAGGVFEVSGPPREDRGASHHFRCRARRPTLALGPPSANGWPAMRRSDPG